MKTSAVEAAEPLLPISTNHQKPSKVTKGSDDSIAYSLAFGSAFVLMCIFALGAAATGRDNSPTTRKNGKIVMVVSGSLAAFIVIAYIAYAAIQKNRKNSPSIN